MAHAQYVEAVVSEALELEVWAAQLPHLIPLSMPSLQQRRSPNLTATPAALRHAHAGSNDG